jgi:class 3 adenylate cyclase
VAVEPTMSVKSTECEVRGDDLGGLAVHIAARVGALVEPGEILVSGMVKDLVVGSGIDFGDRGEHELKGVPGSWKLFAVER